VAVADKTGIQWTEATWNPLVGCTAVSPGCDHCYAAREASGRLSQLPLYSGLARAGVFTGEVRLVSDRLDQPLRWRRPRRVFVNSMSDLFHDAVPDEFIVEVFARMWWSPKHTFQVLTKRHGRLRSLLSQIEEQLRQRETDLGLVDCPTPLRWPLPNVWLGVSVENQKWADIRIPALLDTPAAVRWLSCEPLLGRIDLTQWLSPRRAEWGEPYAEPTSPAGLVVRDLILRPGIDWVVVGGESGPAARPMHPDSARLLRDQCTAAGVPFFFKQWGEWAPYEVARPVASDPGTCAVHPSGMTALRPDNPFDPFAAGHPYWTSMVRAGKKRAGRELDGRTWDEYPEVDL